VLVKTKSLIVLKTTENYEINETKPGNNHEMFTEDRIENKERTKEHRSYTILSGNSKFLKIFVLENS
jgi:hypothetical protein